MFSVDTFYVFVAVFSGQIVGEHEGTAFPFHFSRGKGVSLAYTKSFGAQPQTPLGELTALPQTLYPPSWILGTYF